MTVTHALDHATSIEDAHDQAERVRSGDVARTHYVERAIERILTMDAEIGAIAHRRFDEALEEAGAVPTDAPFAGVPVLVKDLMCPVEGLPESNGNRLLKERAQVAAWSSILVDRLRVAGFVVLGSTCTAEFGATITTETSAFGPTRNPHELNHSSGGSSGGAAAAVAAGYVPVAHGNDASGSLRIPASFCGVLGYKPARGRVDDRSDPGSWFGLAVQGPIARTVRDLRAMTGVLADDPRLLRGAVVTGRPLLPRTGVLDVRQRPELSHEVAAALCDAERCLVDAGHDVAVIDRASCPMFRDDFGRHFALAAAAGVTAELTRIADTGHPDIFRNLEPATAALVQLAERRSAADFARTHGWLMELRADLATWWRQAGLDVMVTPVVTSAPPRLGDLSDPVRGGRLVAEIMRFTAQINVTGQPAVSVPVASDSPLPVGVQLVGASGSSEDALWSVATDLMQ
jgi:amidase